MSVPPRPAAATPLAQALGKVPSGLYILTARDSARSTGMLASWVQQASFDPPMVTVALSRQRFIADWLRASGRFTLNQLAEPSKALIRHFARGFDAGADAFEGVALREDCPSPETGGPVLAHALAFLDLEVAGEHEAGDHLLFLGRVVGGGLLTPGAEPFLHVRGSGLHY